MMLGMFALMVGLFALGTPIAFSMALAAAVYMQFAIGVPLEGLAQRMVGGLDTFPLLAIPFFMLAGSLMNTGGITIAWSFAKVLVGHITGGLSHVVVVTNMIMAGMSGSAVADAAGTGSVLIPAMKSAGYPTPYAAAIVGAASMIGPIIPPSIPFVVYGSVANASIGRLLLGGAVPGVIMGIFLMIFGYIIAKRRGYPSEQRATCGQMGTAFVHALPPLGMPAIILGGIVLGIMTPTEAASAGAAYALVLGLFIYKELKWSHLPKIITEAAVGTASIAVIIAAAQPFAWVLTIEQAPQRLLEAFIQWDLEQWQVFLILNIVFFILGMFMEGLAALIMAVPVLLPLIAHAHIDPVHFGVVFVVNIMIGLITPPVGMAMYVVCALSKVSIIEFVKEVWPFIIAEIIALGIITYVPEVVLWLPNLLLPAR